MFVLAYRIVHKHPKSPYWKHQKIGRCLQGRNQLANRVFQSMIAFKQSSRTIFTLQLPQFPAVEQLALSINGAVRQFCSNRIATIQELDNILPEYDLKRSSVAFPRKRSEGMYGNLTFCPAQVRRVPFSSKNWEAAPKQHSTTECDINATSS